jgi:hypothetical protein
MPGGEAPTVGAPYVVQLDDADTPVDVIDAMALEPFLAGRHPVAVTRRIDRLRPDATLLPAGAEVLRRATEDGRTAVLAAGAGWTLRAVRWRNSSGEVTVSAISEELAAEVVAAAIRDAEAPAPADDTVAIGFWHLSGRGGSHRARRTIGAVRWADIRRNYAAPVAAGLDRLVALGPDDVLGRLLLLHGAPGTGKTSALRALANEWRAWCRFDCVLDPERLFGDPSYLMDVAVADHHGDGDESEGAPRRWRLLLLEDCDELIRGEAKSSTGQALSRLLNLTDGLLGQGRDVLVAITTNEDLARLHPAVVRPGRCLAQIEVGRLSYPEAVQWLGTSTGVPAGGATLAELYALRGGEPVTVREPERAVGGYL